MRSFLPSLALASAAGLLAFAVVATAQKDAEPTVPSWRVPKGDVARGAGRAQVCLTCHGVNGAPSDPPAPKLRRQRTSYIFKALQEYRSGERKSDIMQPFAQELSDQDMRDLAVYLSGELLDVPPKAHSELPIYRRIARECAWCHGETGIGEFEGMPVLTGQDPTYIAHALSAYRDGARTSPIMRSVVKDLPAQEDAALADYYSRHEWLERNK
ncbi:MAG: cytochrome c4 [Sphingomonadales bacterium]|nr:cytochrome c4 [Sphingomonadales bacterium]